MAANQDPFFCDRLFLQFFRYRYINRNEYEGYTNATVRQWILEVYFQNMETAPGPSCQCQITRGMKCADDNCPLRFMKLECPSSCGEKCRNQIFARNQLSNHLKIQGIDGFGLSLVPTQAIEEKVPVVEYVGLLKQGQIRQNQTHCLPLTKFRIRGPLYVCQRTQANESRFLHHSKNPNCAVQEWIVEKEIRLLVVAIRNIQPDEVLTIKFPQREAGPSDRFWKFLPHENYYDEGWLRPTKHSEIVLPEHLIRPSLVYNRQNLDNLPGRLGSVDRPYFCCVRNCPFRYRTEREIVRHMEREHTARIPDVIVWPQSAPRRSDPSHEDRSFDEDDEDGESAQYHARRRREELRKKQDRQKKGKK